MNYKMFDIFSPMIFVILVIVYLIFSQIAFHYHLKELIGININTIYVICLGLVFYIIGVYITQYLLKNRTLTLKE